MVLLLPSTHQTHLLCTSSLRALPRLAICVVSWCPMNQSELASSVAEGHYRPRCSTHGRELARCQRPSESGQLKQTELFSSILWLTYVLWALHGLTAKEEQKACCFGSGRHCRMFWGCWRANHASPNGQCGEEILALMRAITMMNPNYIAM